MFVNQYYCKKYTSILTKNQYQNDYYIYNNYFIFSILILLDMHAAYAIESLYMHEINKLHLIIIIIIKDKIRYIDPDGQWYA